MDALKQDLPAYIIGAILTLIVVAVSIHADYRHSQQEHYYSE